MKLAKEGPKIDEREGISRLPGRTGKNMQSGRASGVMKGIIAIKIM